MGPPDAPFFCRIRDPSLRHDRGGGGMTKFEYDITTHSADTLRDIVYFCSTAGECDLRRLPGDQVAKLKEMLSQRGAEGWELVQLTFGKDGILIFWKRVIIEDEA